MPSTLAELDLQSTGSCASFNFRRAARAVTRFYDQAFESVRHPLHTIQYSYWPLPKPQNPTSISALSEVLVIDRTTLTRSFARASKAHGLLSISDRSIKTSAPSSVSPPKVSAAWPPPSRLGARPKTASLQTLGLDYWAHFRNELEKLTRVTLSLERIRRTHRGPAAIARHV